MTYKDRLEQKIRRAFTNRTHKFPQRKVEIIQTPETQNQRFIIAPYDKTVEKLTNIAVAMAQDLLEECIGSKYTLKTGYLWDSADATDGYHYAQDQIRNRAKGLLG